MVAARALVAAMATTIFALGASSASAAGVAPDGVSNPVTVSQGGSSVGTMSLTTTLDSTTASGTARAGSLRLPSGHSYRIQTCVWAKWPAAPPQTQCESEVATADLLGGLTGVRSPTAQLTIQRPAAGTAAATIAAIVIVDMKDSAGRWVGYASSWPQDGMPSAGVAVPAVDQSSGAVLAPQGNVLPGVRQGGINTGTQDSICQGTYTPATAPAQGSTDALGSLPAPYEVGEPLAGGRPRGVMIVLHGGTWQMYGPGAMESTRDDADRWRGRGWRTVLGDYRPCADSIDDVVALFDRVREVYGSARPICVTGQSAGGHLALLLASVRPQVACVVSEAGPADLTKLAGQVATARDGSPSTIIPVQLSNVTVSAFGADRQAQISPTKRGVAGRVLFGIAASDAGIPWAQATDFAAAQRARDASSYVDTQRLDDGGESWVHADVSPAALQRFHQREEALVEPLVNGGMAVSRSIRLKTLRRSGLRLAYTCPGSCKVKAKLALDARTARRLKLSAAIGSARGSRARFGTSRLAVKLGAKARSRVRARRTLRVVLTMSGDGATKRFAANVRLR